MVKTVLVYIKSVAGSKEEMAEVNRMNIASFALSLLTLFLE
jgi:hypothetical protein